MKNVISEYRIYNRELSAKEIRELYEHWEEDGDPSLRYENGMTVEGIFYGEYEDPSRR